MTELRAILAKKLSKIDERKKALVNRMLDGIIDQETYKEHNGCLREEAEQTKAEIRGTELEEIDLESVLQFADRIILRPARPGWNHRWNCVNGSRRHSSLTV